MARLQRKRFTEPAEVRTFPRGKVDIVELDDVIVGRMTHEPGWRWSVDFAAMRNYGRSAEHRGERILASILFTDIVDSTTMAQRLGAGGWLDLVAAHNERVQSVLNRYSGRIVKTTGDGILALFDGAERAVRATAALHDAIAAFQIQLRAGIHTGEVELVAGDVRGVAVHAAARVMAIAGPGETLVSGTTRDLLDGTGLEFENRGNHVFKGLSGSRPVFALKRV